MSPTVLTTTQAARLLGVSRQHLADLADRGEIESWRAGSHRRFDRGAVLAHLLRQKGGADADVDRLAVLNLNDRRSLAYGLLVATRLITEPNVVMAVGHQNLDHLREVHSDGSADYYLDRWEALLSGPIELLLRALTSLDDESVALRHASPFAGLLSDNERREVIVATRAVA
jgi:excisionase family DNA binding protein